MQTIARKFWELEVPTWILAVAIYGSWFLLIWFHAWIAWWAMIFLGGYVIAWQFSLQHETIHGFRGVAAWFRTLIAMPPLGPWFPYLMYRRSHSLHHRKTYLTVPGQDSETHYVKQADWARAGRLERAILLFNQTLVELPRFYRENRAKPLKHNGNFVFTGYWPIARDCMFKPVFTPVHPTARSGFLG